ncbi:hypothetical protein PAP_04455 [Palaeococcus pacificus DY20341]|uniref:Archaeal flagella protein FlaD/E domain-containing protein n=1 Tax=Palaeococcus pacificus DY20341 TaxID=1343739 RepID=A0A075LTL8_9EURY|nr:FlaD/FlaE family flagellar protein [Palaeococcus pacificus]AIF69302.1 hypothetical protein PAP_04455 [Palaeococcus pacificus DY20341]
MISEIEIDEKLKKLQGKVPSILINDLREKLVAKMDVLEPKQVDKIIEKVVNKYTSQSDRLVMLDKRIEEIGRHLEDISRNLGRTYGKNEMWGNGGNVVDNGAWGIEIKEEIPMEKENRYMGESFKEPNDNSTIPEFNIPREVESVLFSAPKKAYRLEKLPNDMISMMTAFKWLGFLMEKVGVQNLENVLEYYHELGWISEEVLNDLLKYAKGTKPHHREPNWKPEDKLTIQDHVISLLFLERLRGVRISRETLNSLEREMKLITRAIEEFYGV